VYVYVDVDDVDVDVDDVDVDVDDVDVDVDDGDVDVDDHRQAKGLPYRAQYRPAHQHRQHVAAPLWIDADVRERLALLVRAAAQLLGEDGVGGVAVEILQPLDQ